MLCGCIARQDLPYGTCGRHSELSVQQSPSSSDIDSQYQIYFTVRTNFELSMVNLNFDVLENIVVQSSLLAGLVRAKDVDMTNLQLGPTAWYDHLGVRN